MNQDDSVLRGILVVERMLFSCIALVRDRLLRGITVVQGRLPYRNKFGTGFGFLRPRLSKLSRNDTSLRMERSGMKQSVAYYGHYYNCDSSEQVVYEHYGSSGQVATLFFHYRSITPTRQSLTGWSYR